MPDKPFHGGNTGSNPVGDANKISHFTIFSSSPRRPTSAKGDGGFREQLRNCYMGFPAGGATESEGNPNSSAFVAIGTNRFSATKKNIRHGLMRFQFASIILLALGAREGLSLSSLRKVVSTAVLCNGCQDEQPRPLHRLLLL
jgi:hypothetical protein